MKLPLFLTSLFVLACTVPAFLRNPPGPRLCSDYCPGTSGCVGGQCIPLEGSQLHADAGLTIDGGAP